MMIITLNSDKSYNYNYNYDVKMMKIVFVPILIKKTNNFYFQKSDDALTFYSTM